MSESAAAPAVAAEGKNGTEEGKGDAGSAAAAAPPAKKARMGGADSVQTPGAAQQAAGVAEERDFDEEVCAVNFAKALLDLNVAIYFSLRLKRPWKRSTPTRTRSTC
jgi:hypothetical protein